MNNTDKTVSVKSAVTRMLMGELDSFDAFEKEQLAARANKAKANKPGEDKACLDPNDDARSAVSRFTFASYDDARAFLIAYKKATDMRDSRLVGDALKLERKNRIIVAMGSRYCPGLPFGIQVDLALWLAQGLVCPERRALAPSKKEGVKKSWSQRATSYAEKELVNFDSRLRVAIADACESVQDYQVAVRLNNFEHAVDCADKMVSNLLKAVLYTEVLAAKANLGVTVNHTIPWALFGLDNPDAQTQVSELALIPDQTGESRKALVEIVMCYMADEADKQAADIARALARDAMVAEREAQAQAQAEG